ncbi:hypothetical protein [Brucella pseudogrignonensis]|uniref:hypothetical protein n=1 Tax=Brucella pseudogrignonensis TaxID=419475 RepID=UPI0011B024E0|nr:hypothetical protein [Brucella pseudogrignonensis]MQP39614.1 hypothetical protein [Ochrobactrum sp. MYb237]
MSVKKILKPNIKIILTVVIIAILAISILKMSQDFALPEFCADSDSNATECIRNWLGALSGWIGAVVAGLALFALFAQIREQRRQTEFIIGDSLPTLDALQHITDDKIVVVRIVNWNRRSLIIEKVDAPPTGAGIYVGYRKLKIGSEKKSIKSGWVDLAIEGWIDRTKPPAVVEIQLTRYGFSDDREFVEATWEDVEHVIVEAQLIDGRHKKIVLQAELNKVAD